MRNYPECEICKTAKPKLYKVKTYNGSYVFACKSCEDDLKFTLNMMKIGYDSILKTKKHGKIYASTHKFVINYDK